MPTATYVITAELPDLEIWWKDNRKRLIDFSDSWTFELAVGRDGETTALLTKNDGFTGAVGSDDEPNVTISWDVDEFAELTAGRYTAELTATKGGKDRVVKFAFVLGSAFSAAAS